MATLLSWYNPEKRMIYEKFYKTSTHNLLYPLKYKNSYGHIVIGRYQIKNNIFIDIDTFVDRNFSSSDKKRFPFFKKRKDFKKVIGK